MGVEEVSSTVCRRVMNALTSPEFSLVSSFYGEEVAKRSKVPKINHIKEGLTVLASIGASDVAMWAFCLHPMLQDPHSLAKNYEVVCRESTTGVIMMAIEYRNIANQYLSPKVNTGHKIVLSPLGDVNDMLIADKVQNRKDFITYHRETHPRSAELDQYFNDWLNALHVSEQQYTELCDTIDTVRPIISCYQPSAVL